MAVAVLVRILIVHCQQCVYRDFIVYWILFLGSFVFHWVFISYVQNNNVICEIAVKIKIIDYIGF